MGSARVPDETLAIRDAATIILTRRRPTGPEVLMGQRGSAAVFMPSKYVFPGGGLDLGDADIPLARPLDRVCAARLAQGATVPPHALAVTAIRELWEETGLPLGRAGSAPLTDNWSGFFGRGLLPDAAALRFVFRAITPPGRTRRFDARFFLADAEAIAGDSEDFSAASDELGHLHWLPLGETRHLDLPFITEVVLAEVAHLLAHPDVPHSVPFFDNSGAVPTFRRIV
jgi:8-oxo-dGTP pyrophosphatase MutT (NUDIX family)